MLDPDPIPNDIDIIKLLSNPFFEVLKYIDEKDKDEACLKLIKKLSVCDVEDIYYIFAFAWGTSPEEAKNHFIKNIDPKEKLECLKHLGYLNNDIIEKIFGSIKEFQTFVFKLKVEQKLELVKSLKFKSLNCFKLLFEDFQKEFIEKTDFQQKLEYINYFKDLDFSEFWEMSGGEGVLKNSMLCLKPNEILELAKSLSDKLSLIDLNASCPDFLAVCAEKLDNQQKLECIKYFKYVRDSHLDNIFGGEKKLKEFLYQLFPDEIPKLVKSIKWYGLRDLLFLHTDMYTYIYETLPHFPDDETLYTNFKIKFIKKTTWQERLECVKHFRILSADDLYKMFRKEFRKKVLPNLTMEQRFELLKPEDDSLNYFYPFSELFVDFRKEFVEGTTLQEKFEYIKRFHKVDCYDFYKMFGCKNQKEFKENVAPKLTVEQKFILLMKSSGDIELFDLCFKNIEQFYKETNEHQRYLFLRSLRYYARDKIRQKISEIEEKEKSKISPNISTNTENNTNKDKNESTISTESKEIGDL